MNKGSKVTVSYLSQEELEKYRNRPVKKRNKEKRPADWRWPQNRKANEQNN